MAEMILVVDDETEIAELVEVYLKNEGYLVKRLPVPQRLCILQTPSPLHWHCWT